MFKVRKDLILNPLTKSGNLSGVSLKLVENFSDLKQIRSYFIFLHAAHKGKGKSAKYCECEFYSLEMQRRKNFYN
jgi:hypothetical protein